MQAFGLARIGRDVELRATPGGEQVANLSLAFTWGRKDAEGKRPTEWVDASLWGKRAEAMAPYLLKGQLVSVTLEDIHIQSFTKRDNTGGTKLAARVSAIEFAGAAPAKAAAAPPPPKPAPKSASDPAAFSDMDDDIPF